MDKRLVLAIIGAAIAGAACTWIVPASWILALVLVSFFACIVTGWVLAFQNGAINRGFVAILFPINPLISVRRSPSVTLFAMFASFAIGACLGLLWLVSRS